MMRDKISNKFLLVCFLIVFATSCQTNGSPSPGDEPPLATAVPADDEPAPLNTAAAATKTPNPDNPTPTQPVNEPLSTPDGTAPPVEPTITAPPTAAATIDPADLAEGALIDVQMDGTVGILLDGVPPALLADTIDFIMEQDDDYWQALAYRQMSLTKYRLNFRNFKRPGKGQLPLPPESLWQITLDSAAPRRVTILDHDLIVRDYQFQSTLLTNADSVEESEPQLTQIGGIWQETFVLPLDPDFLLQRTGLACVNEAGFPPNSYDSENIRTFYDFSCTPSSTGKLGCHRTQVPTLTCLEAVDGLIGRLDTAVQFERLEWDDELADAVRIGEVSHVDAPDLDVVEGDLLKNRIIYRYFEADSCAMVENAVGGTGWRRLLQFTATLHNRGGAALHIGPVVAEDPRTNIFQYNACHDHFHFSNYGDFILADDEVVMGGKQAFCVESTNRTSNNEAAPLTHNYSCSVQGIQAGWVDEYIAGLDAQWIDITDLSIEAEAASASLSFVANQDQFLCEGTAVLDSAGQPLYEPTGKRTQTGLPISRPQCELIEAWDQNNSGTQTVDITAVGSFVTEPCQENQFGSLRNCGFSSYEPPVECLPGETVTVTLNLDEPAILRACEVSDQLGVGVACSHNDALTNVIVGLRSESTVQLVCPLVRDYEFDEEDEDARLAIGGYALYLAPYFE